MESGQPLFNQRQKDAILIKEQNRLRRQEQLSKIKSLTLHVQGLVVKQQRLTLELRRQQLALKRLKSFLNESSQLLHEEAGSDPVMGTMERDFDRYSALTDYLISEIDRITVC
jgi:hypothetical protein